PHARPTPAAFVLLPACVFVGGAAWETFSLRWVAPAVRLLLVGTSGAAETLVNDIRRGHAGGYELVGVVAEPESLEAEPHVSILGSVDELDRVIAEHRPDLVVLTLLTLPLFPLLALLVRQTEGPVILRQERLGEHGKLFTIYKFRTMRADAEQNGRAVWAGDGDPRVTRAGAFMRRLRLDELP